MNPVDNTGAETSGVRLDFGVGTDRGLRRELNEDSFWAADPLFTVADGMGGHEAGEVASYECIHTLGNQPFLAAGSRTATASDMQQALHQADARIREVTNSRAGTTVTGVVVVQERDVPYWLVFNVGDSRTYRLSQGRFGQISVDHSEVQELLDGGLITPGQALIHPRRHVVTRAVGAGSDGEADFWLLPVEEGDRILVCSDGLTGELSDSQIHNALTTIEAPQDVVDLLIQAALRSGGRDNITVIVVDASNVMEASNLMSAASAETLKNPTTAPQPVVLSTGEFSQPRKTAPSDAGHAIDPPVTPATAPSSVPIAAAHKSAAAPLHEENHG